MAGDAQTVYRVMKEAIDFILLVSTLAENVWAKAMQLHAAATAAASAAAATAPTASGLHAVNPLASFALIARSGLEAVQQSLLSTANATGGGGGDSARGASAAQAEPPSNAAADTAAFDPLVFVENLACIAIGAGFFAAVHESNGDKCDGLDSLLRALQPVLVELDSISARFSSLAWFRSEI